MARPQSKASLKPKSDPVKKGSRKLKQPVYKPLRFKKRIKHPIKLPSAWRIFKASMKHMYTYKKVLSGITIIYVLLAFLLVRGLGLHGEINTAKKAFDSISTGFTDHVAGVWTVFGMLVSSGSPTSDVGSAYQTILLVVTSLALIWTLRKTHAREVVTLKNAFYKSTYPLVPFLLVILIIAIQLIPFLLGNFIYSLTVASGVANRWYEQLAWGGVAFAGAVMSIYMICGSVFALYIVTLPNMTPRQATRAARKLVRYRRWTIIRKILFLPVMVALLFSVLMLPIILFVTPIAEVVFLLLSGACLVVAHSYMYSLYRELL